MNTNGIRESGVGIRDLGFVSRESGVGIRRVIAVFGLLAVASSAAAQLTPKPPAPAPAQETAVSPIECWWKTDRSAIRVGELFQLTLTCAVVDTEKIKVVVDESSLAPSALHLVPFEIVDGHRYRDILNSPRRFFQYQYTMRVLGEAFFVKEVSLPRLQLSYRVQNALNGGSSLSGREAQYSLRPVPIRVLSLVPAGTNDIRDTPPDTFGDVDSRLFRSNLLLISGGVAAAMALLLAILAIVTAFAKRRATSAVRKRQVSPVLVLRAASRELSAVKSASQENGWTSDLAGRAAAALRLAGAVAVGKRISQREAERGSTPSEGQIALRRGVRGRKLILSAATTPGVNGSPVTPGQNGAADIWNGISQTLTTFSAARYSRPSASSGTAAAAGERNGSIDSTALDSALADAQDLVRRLFRRQILRAATFQRTRPAESSEAAKQSWAR